MNHFNWVKALLLAGALTTATFSHTQGQVKDKLVKEGNTKFIRFQKSSIRLGKIEKSAGASQVLKDYLPLSKNDEFRLLQDKVGSLQMRHQKFQQYSKGIKVEFATYSIHSKGGYITAINGDFAPVGDINIVPSLTEEEALKYASKHAGQFTNSSKGELVIVQDFEGDQTYKLAYKFLMPQTGDMYIDAHRGTLLFKNSRTHSCFAHAHKDEHTHRPNKETHTKKSAAQGNAETLYSGRQTIQTQAYEGGYRLFDETRGKGIHVKKKNPEYEWDYDDPFEDFYEGHFYHATEFVDNDNNWTAEEWSQTVSDEGALDAFWACGKTYDYYKEVRHRNSIDDQGKQIRVLIGPNNGRSSYAVDASIIIFGTGGNGNTLATLDLAAHEFTHGVTQFTANLLTYDEPGALNEGFSDIFGAVIENWVNVGKEIWLIGEDEGVSTRNMQNPKEKGHPDTYKGENWYKGGVHTKNGVLNHWFYILSEGKQGVNDNGESYKVRGLGIDKAADIAYRTLITYLSSNSGYAETRVAGIQAAIDLYGEGSEEEKQVTNAFYAVGVGENFLDATCPVTTSLSFSEIGDTQATVNWEPLDGVENYKVRYRQDGKSKWFFINDVTTNSAVLDSLKPGFTYLVEVKASCSEGSFGDYSTAHTVTTTGEKVLVYCDIKGFNGLLDHAYIDKVSLGDGSKTSGDGGGYKDYSQEPLTSVYAGETTDISLSMFIVKGFPYGGASFAVWIDYNQDGDFEEEGEDVLKILKYSEEVHETITIPTYAKLGTTRMRVVMIGGAYPEPCRFGRFYYGDIEDHSITITEGEISGIATKTKATKKDVSLYPNPNNKGVATIVIPGGDNIEVIIADAHGKVMVEKAITSQGDLAQGELDVSSLQPGMYIVRIFGKDNTILETKKLFIR